MEKGRNSKIQNAPRYMADIRSLTFHTPLLLIIFPSLRVSWHSFPTILPLIYRRKTNDKKLIYLKSGRFEIREGKDRPDLPIKED